MDANLRRFPAWKIYLLVIVPITILLNFAFPNFHAPDDYDHVKRAYTLLHQPFRTITPEGQSSGAMIDTGLALYIDAQSPLAKSAAGASLPEREAVKTARNIRWTGNEKFSEMPGALSYFPLLYAPQSIMLEAGRDLGATIRNSVLWARLANGLVAIALTATGLYFLRIGEGTVLSLLLLPRTLLQFASDSADPILYGLTLIVIALALNATVSRRMTCSVTPLALFVSGTVRPPLLAFALPACVRAIRERRWINFGLVVGSCLAAAAWVVAILPSITDRRCGNVGTAGSKLESFALHWPQLIGHSFDDRGFYYYVSLIGHYGWGDARTGIIGTPLPAWVYLAALPLFALALCRDLLSPAALPRALRVALLLSAVSSALLTFLAMYVGCTVPGQTVIGGVQGRYFVPVLFCIGPAIGGVLSRKLPINLDRLYGTALVGWSIACTATMVANAHQLYVR